MAPRTEVNPIRDVFDAAVRGYTIKLTCLSCKHSRVFDPHALWWFFHRRDWNDRLPFVRRRAVCLACWRGRRRKVRQPRLELVREQPTGEELPMPPVDKWKAEMRRVR